MLFHIIIFFFFSFFTLILSVFFFFRKLGNIYLNRLLAIYTFLFGYEMAFGCLRWSGLLRTKEFVHFNETHALVWLLYGPLIYMYVRYAITKVKFKVSDILFLVPPGVILMLYAPFYFKSTSEKLAIVTNNAIYDYALFPSYAIWIVIFGLFFYAGLTYFKYKDYKIGFKENLWLKWFVGSYFAFALLFFAYVFLVRFNIMSYTYDYFVDGAILFFIVLLCYFGLVQPDVFNGLKSIKEFLPFKKYKKTGLSKALAQDYKIKLTTLMEEDKPYLRNDLRLNDLAALLNISRHHTSQIINEHFNLSFFDFINNYRVDDAKKMLIEYQKEDLNINQIAYSVGFNNRASFYKAFRKFTNATPTDYANRMKVS